MRFRVALTIASAVVIAAIIIDWPRALAGLAFGLLSHHLPYCTIIIALGSSVISAIGEFVYLAIGRETEPTLASFLIGLFAVAGSASSIHITMRDWKNKQ